MSYELRSARWIAADVLRQVVQPGDTVVDATLGNGHDLDYHIKCNTAPKKERHCVRFVLE